MADARWSPVREIPEQDWVENVDKHGLWDPRCRRITRRGTRCKFPIIPACPVMYPRSITDEHWQRYLDGSCGVHRSLEGVDPDG